jgi:hypothetical protein
MIPNALVGQLAHKVGARTQVPRHYLLNLCQRPSTYS